jgi:phage baseplate assembly protein W
MANERDKQIDLALGHGIEATEILPGVDIGRDIAFVAGANGLDFAMVKGVDNLAQALTIALTTRLGDDVFNVRFGFDGLNALVEETNPVIARERIRISVIRVLQNDPRVRRILDVKLQDGRLDRPSAGNTRELTVRVEFETITGDQLAIDMGKVAVNV